MRRYIVLLLILGTVWAQTDFDKLVLKKGAVYSGKFLGVKAGIIFFEPTNTNIIKVDKVKIRSLEQKKKVLIQGGTWKTNSKPYTILGVDHENLSLKHKGIYDAKKDARKWLAFPPLALISSGGLGTATFFIFDDYFDTDYDLSLISAFIVGYLGWVSTYYLFSIEDKKNIQATSAEDIELYKKMYYKQFEKQKLKNIIISTGVIALTAGAVIFYALSNLSLDFGPNPHCCF